MTDTSVHRTLQDPKSENTTLQQGYIAVILHKSVLLSYLPHAILKVTPRGTILLITLPWQRSCRLKHHYPQVKLVGSVTVAQPDSSDQDQTVPATPLEVPALEVAVVRTLWPAGCYLHLGLLNMMLHLGDVL
jgi:hypothetical protein